MKKIAKVFGSGTSKKKTPVVDMPEEQPTVEIPDEDVVRINAQRAQAKRRSSGRISTLLTGDGQQLG
jgi:hypothetical protein